MNSYVAAGYLITLGSLAAYALSVLRRERRLAPAPGDGDEE